ncbi:MAG: hypothetical protein H0Z39_02860 [Peptococcaceae bacterium]|nr:hypothetical protein [Peptococcaceae bacterium]
MLFVRTGPRFLFLQSPSPPQLEEVLVQKLGGKTLDLGGALKESSDADTIVLITPSGGPVADIDSVQQIVLVQAGSSIVMIQLVNLGLISLVTQATLGPGLLVQRLPRGSSAVLETIKEEYGATALPLIKAIGTGKADDTVITFTDKPLHKAIKVEDIFDITLLVHRPIPKLFRELSREAIRYITKGLDDNQWYEVRINIYDTDEEYKTHYRRLVTVLEDLEAGLILGEAWTRDHALALFSVVAYQIRLFTMLHPLELKRILLGLEYTDSGSRCADIDLYYRRKKVEWAEAKQSPSTRASLGVQYRKELLARLHPHAREKVLQLEQSIGLK